MITVKKFLKYLLVVFFVAGGVNHFINPDFYFDIMPEYIPAHRLMVLLSGATEIVAGLMLATPRLSELGAWFILAHLAIFMTVHIDMIVHAEERYPEIPIAGLWVRIPIQALFAIWAYWFTKGANRVTSTLAESGSR